MRLWNRVLLFALIVCHGTMVACHSTMHLPAPTKKKPQYKRVHQRALRSLLADDAAGALNEIATLDDAETDFILTLAHARAGKLDEAEHAMERALARGLPPSRFLAGPRELLQPLEQRQALVTLRERRGNQLVHGPMLGAVTSTSASVWVRTAEPATVEVVATASPGGTEFRATGRTREASDRTCVLRLAALEPETTYQYEVRVNDQPATFRQQGQLRTSSTRRSPQPFTLAFGGGAGFVPANERVWDTISGFTPHLLLLLGDNVYSDDPESRTMQRYCYYRRQSRQEFRNLVARTPVYTIWDDHDFGTNDCWGGPARAEPAWKLPVWETFRNNWANPGYGGGSASPGCWYTFSVGDVDFFLLDGRYYRTDPKVERPSMLGPEQKSWLKEALRRSTGTFKVLCSPVPWDFRTKGDSLDTWNGFQAERQEIFDFLHSERIEGVVLMSADRHRSDAWKISRDPGYDLYEFNSSRLTNQHVHKTQPEALFSYNEKQSFGLVDFDTRSPEAKVRYRIVTIDGEIVHELTVFRSQLSYR